jgi:two-component system chemotaxis response regulator CheB
MMKVLIVDDSRIFRKQVELALAEIDEIEIVGSVWSGQKALDVLLELQPDLITLDQEMPERDGLTTLMEIQRLNHQHGLKMMVVMLSSHTEKSGEVTMKALDYGALDFVAKPSGPDMDVNRHTLVTQLREKIDACRGHVSKTARTIQQITSPEIKRSDSQALLSKPALMLKDDNGKVPQIIAIGISTGGPKALQNFLPQLCQLTQLPVIIVQHMPPKFTKSLAQSLNRVCEHEVCEVEGKMVIEPRHVYIAPGGFHLLVRLENGEDDGLPKTTPLRMIGLIEMMVYLI